MKLTLEYDDMYEAKAALDGAKYKSALYELDQYLRSRIKYEALEDAAYTALEETRSKLHELTTSEGLSIS